jgi:galactokinase
MIDLIQRFKSLYRREPRLFRAPGRVNLIGEHTDYNDGFVMPAAIDFYTYAAVAARNDRNLVIRSENLVQQLEFDLDDPSPRASGNWSDYVRGIAVVFQRAGLSVGGADLLIHSDVPIGAGLSSSAAIEVSVAMALSAVSGFTLDRTEMAKLCQRAENEFVGMRCGIMDQFVSCNGQAGKALMLDCRSLDFELLPLPENASLVICNSMVKHELASGEYNVRREQCEAGLEYLRMSLPQIQALRDVWMDDLQRFSDGLSDVIYRRCRHVITENGRVLAGASALKNGDLVGFGRLMGESHRSLRDDYEVSCAELDFLVESANRVDGVYGSRMTGGGFGGCTINLVAVDHVQEFTRSVAADYDAKFGHRPEIYVSIPAEGATELPTTL